MKGVGVVMGVLRYWGFWGFMGCWGFGVMKGLVEFRKLVQIMDRGGGRYAPPHSVTDEEYILCTSWVS